MTQKRGEVDEKVGAAQLIPDVYENWLNKRVKAMSGTLGKQEEEDELDKAEDLHEKAHRRKRGKTTR